MTGSSTCYRASSGLRPVAGQRVMLSPLCSEQIHRQFIAHVDKTAPATIDGYMYVDVREVLPGGRYGPPLPRYLVNIAGLVLYPQVSGDTSTTA
jgi:hypothetical protein